MSTKEYIVSLKRDVDFDQFWHEMESRTKLANIPDRPVHIVNNRDASIRQCHYALTDNEAAALKNDVRVLNVELITSFKPMRKAAQSGNFNKTTVQTGNAVNWGLRRCVETTNIYGTGTTVAGNYNYALDGTGVDIVILDSGIQVDHPEFKDANGVSRVQTIDWFTASGVVGTMAENHYVDTDGHGTHVAGIAAGLTYGWAKNAKIFSIKVDGLDGGEGGGISAPTCFDVVIGWHNNKPVDPATGFKRPTIVNMSWGYIDYFESINGGTYRTAPWSGTSRRTDYGMVGSFDGTGYVHGVRVAYVDVSVQEMIDAGIHVTISAGNEYMKVDAVGGDDYDNFYVGGYYNGQTPNYYHRGSSPYDNEAFIVGSVDSSYVADTSTEQKSAFSNAGPGVDLYAPGSSIPSCTCNSSGVPYYLNASFKQKNISGTSMAAPQVCGVGAVLLQLYPGATPAQLKNFIMSNSVSGMLHSSGSGIDYTNSRSLFNGANKYLFNKFGIRDTFQLSGAVAVQNINVGY